MLLLACPSLPRSRLSLQLPERCCSKALSLLKYLNMSTVEQSTPSPLKPATAPAGADGTACSQLPGQNPKTIFDSSLPALSRKPTHEKIVNSTSVISLQSGPSSLLHCSCPSPGFSTSHMTCFQNFLNYILSVHLYFLIHFTHTANPLVKANIELLLFLGVLALAHCLK